jgi:multidrug transporter EmrE-like cation transporter
MRSILLNLCSAAFAVTSNSLLKHAIAGRIAWRGSPGQLCTEVFALLRLPLVWVAIFFFVAANIAWLLVLSSQQMAVAYPLQITLLFVFSTIAAVVIFSERLSGVGYLGLAVIFVGIVLLRSGGFR